jgi:N-dimethylarginine dimethylaminohydrolase
MSLTFHSEFGQIKSVLIKSVENAFISDEKISSQWQALNYLGKPNLQKAIEEYQQFESLLAVVGVNVYHLPIDENVSIDSIYCRDASIATNKGMIICNMGKSGRKHEPQAERIAFEKAGIEILGTIQFPGTLEGGDVAWIDENTLAVGISYRTNLEGIDQLRKLLYPLGVNVIAVPLPHFRGPSDVFHLMSILSPVDKNLAVVYSPLIPIGFRNELLNRGYEFVEVPEEEFDSMGCNVLAVAARECIMVKGNPKTKRSLEEKGCIVHEYSGQEISVKGGGGPTCLTRPLQREVRKK